MNGNSNHKPTQEDRIVGSLLGGALGDALGAPVEFLDERLIRTKYGPEGIRSLDKAYGRVGAITDDTQMTLSTAEGILRALVRGRLRGVSSLVSCVFYAYRRWLYTQRAVDKESHCEGWLLSQNELYSERAPGRTCLSMAKKKRLGVDDIVANNDSKGCGGVMRVAPIGLFHATRSHQTPDSRADAYEDAKHAAALTHGHPTGYIAAGCFAVIIHDLTLGASLTDAIESGIEMASKDRNHEETVGAVREAVELADKPRSRVSLFLLGEGWVAEEALAMSIYCALTAETFEDSLCFSVNHAGDSDSTGAITGNLLGALWGRSVLPDLWLDQLELRDVIEEMSHDLAECWTWDIGHDTAMDDPRVVKYPPG